jgi:DNA-binding transcriptional MerR regulator
VSDGNGVVELEFSVDLVCEIAGITATQLDYWTLRAGIPTHGEGRRLDDLDAVEMVILIKQSRDLGFKLHAAIAAARELQAMRPHSVT